jgi:hypothetical protein
LKKSKRYKKQGPIYNISKKDYEITVVWMIFIQGGSDKS